MNRTNLDKLLSLLPFVQQLFGEPVTLSVMDVETLEIIGKAEHPTLRTGFEVGERMPESIKEGKLFQEFLAGKSAITRQDKGFSGLASSIISITTPIFDDSQQQVLATIGVIKSTEQTDQFLELGQNLLASSQEIYASSETMAEKGVYLSGLVKEMDELTAQLRTHAQSIGGITEGIKSLSAATNILGLNASIESARAGESGRGFSVVADEIRKLSATTTSSVKDIHGRIHKVQDSVTEISKLITGIDSFTQEQAAGIQELKNALESVSAMAETLVQLGTIRYGE